MTRLVVRLLGGYRVELDGQAVYGFETDKARALLAYLVVEADRPHRRETLANLLWPDRPDTAARANLRQALASVRRALSDHDPPFFLFATPTDVQFNTASDYTLDVADLERFTSSPDSSPAKPHPLPPGRQTQLLPDAFCADFLAGFAVPDSEVFQAWVLNKQEYYHRLALEILDDQSTSFEASGDYEQAVAAGRLQLRMEPWLEEAHRRCMRGLALAGRRDEALHQYDLCRRVLETELGVEPAAGTQALHADIRSGRLVAPGSPPAPVGSPQGLPLHSAGRDGYQTRTITVVAREAELGQLGQHLDAALAGETGMVFISGDAGSGKTVLLEAFARSAMADHPDLLVAGARCNPGGAIDPYAPLRRLAGMLFGDLASDAAWRLPERSQVDRLQRATGLLLASLGEYGSELVDTLVPAPSVARRAGVSSNRPAAERPDWWHALGAPLQAILEPQLRDSQDATRLSQRALSQGALTQGALFDELICTLAAIAREQPLLLLFDDLHWVDDATAAFLARLGRELYGSRIVVLGGYRSATVSLGRRDPHSGETVRHPLAAAINELRRVKGEIVVALDRANGRAFVEALVDTEPNRLGARFRDALYAHTGGHALFTVESLHNLQDRGELFKDEAGRWVARESLDWGRLPVRVEAAIAERIDRLPAAEREILACACVQGDDFTGELVAELAGLPVQDVIARLSGTLARQHHLVRPEALQRAEGGEHSTYRFTHHLFQKYLYDQLDAVERAQLHGRVATALDGQTASDPVERERQGAKLAWHYEAGGLPLEAASALLDAGHQAMRVSAFREALNRYDHGLALLATCQSGASGSQELHLASQKRTEIERLLHLARLGPQRNLEGMGSASLQGTVARAIEAGAVEAPGRPRLMMLWGQVEGLLATGQFGDALAIAERIEAEATRRGEEDFVGLARAYVGVARHEMGNPQESEVHLDWMRAWLTPERQARMRAATGIDLQATALSISALNRWFLGYPEQALELSGAAIAGARAAGSTVGQAEALVLGANLQFLLRADHTAMAEQSEQCHRLCVQHGIRMWRVFSEVLLGRLVVMRGGDVAGIERMRSSIDEWQAMGMAIGAGAYVVVLADGCLAAARFRTAGDEARERVLATGLAAIEPLIGASKVPCEQCYEAELCRLRGELLLERDGLDASAEALECFRRALQLGRESGALAWQLRAATSLVGLWERASAGRASAGRASAGRQVAACTTAELANARLCLRDIYGQFTEGFAFPDLRDAAASIGETR